MSPDLAYLPDRKFAVIMIEEDGTEDGDWVVLSGKAEGKIWNYETKDARSRGRRGRPYSR